MMAINEGRIGTMTRRAMACLVVLLFGVVWSTMSDAAAIARASAAFLYDGAKVRVEVFRPAGSARAPAALVLHGASGVGNGYYVYPFAEALARRGVAAYVVRYYDGLGRRGGKASPAIFTTRDRILEKAIDFVLARKDVRQDGVAIYGMSLGGFHALSLGAQDERVKAVATLGGALSRHIPAEEAGRLPPTLLLHGSNDRIVPLDRALETSQAIERSGGLGAIKIYRGEGHELSGAAHADAVESVARFISEGLRGGRQVAESRGR